MKKVKHKTLSASFIVATISILLVQILFFSVLYFYRNEYVLPEPQLRRISYAEWNFYVAQPSTNIYDSTLLQICAFRPYLTLTMWIFNAFHIKTCKIGLFINFNFGTRYTCFADELLCNALHPADDTSSTRNAFFASLCHIDYQGKSESCFIRG